MENVSVFRRNLSLVLTRNFTGITWNHRMAEVEKKLEFIWSNTLLKQDHLELGTQDPVHVAFEYLQGDRHHNLPGQPVSVLGCLVTFTIKKCILMF